ncbi:MAG: TIGR03560 family F420-dependent LLM class oxidoreductase [Candidatus Bathyarchaeota archaeon]|nr:MAG: TIGR03560 family F420-dependent LLM class oxidoreductase [Candidatus Bathyarchaeota archaeon]
MKISINIQPQLGYTYNDIVTLAKAAEDSGFYSFTVSDHFFGPVKGHEMPSQEAWTTLALLVPQTERIRLGTLVTSQSYRNPALLAKIVATLDNASNGRIDLGIGAGWKDSEYEAYGYPFPSARERVVQLREALQIVTLLWTEERPSFEGDFYQIKETMFLPKPVQKPRVPIWVGSMKLNAPMMEETVVRFADGLDYGEGTTIRDFLEKKARVKKMCETIGRDFEELKWSVCLTAGVIGEDADDYKERLKEILEQEWIWIAQASKSVKQKYLESLSSKEIGGTLPDAIQKLSEFEEHADIMNVCLPYFGDLRRNGLATMQILKDQILTAL